eukprot:102131-Chlamydomonas_euryale.AAC.1
MMQTEGALTLTERGFLSFSTECFHVWPQPARAGRSESSLRAVSARLALGCKSVWQPALQPQTCLAWSNCARRSFSNRTQIALLK